MLPALPAWAIAPANHLWQSTAFAGAAWLLTLALKGNRAPVRHAVWLAASIKFLLPFALLMTLAQQATWQVRTAPPRRSPPVIAAIDTAAQPFSQRLNIELAPAARVSGSIASRSTFPLLLAVWIVGVLAIAARWIMRWHRVLASAQAASHAESGRELDALRRMERMTNAPAPIPLAMSDTRIEPGVFGVFRPVLLWPRTIGDCLTDEQLDAIVAHEVCHVRRRDNLTASLHMLTEALFWFHPLVWWIGARLVDERERACDEAVLSICGSPQAYAESILKTCAFSIEAPLPCVSDVTGADLRARVERIMRGDAAATLSIPKRLIVGTFACAAVAVPVALGVGVPERLLAQVTVVDNGPSFDVASIKVNKSGERGSHGGMQPGGRFTATNVTLFQMVRTAYRLADAQVIGGPDWITSEHYDIAAKGPDKPTMDQRASMLQKFIAERFALKIHHETRELPAANLVMARSDGKPGPHLQPATEADADCNTPATKALDFSKGLPPCSQSFSTGQFHARGLTMERFAQVLAASMQLSPFVFDETNLEGPFNIDVLRYRPDGLSAEPPPDRPPGATWPAIDDPNIFTALQEQLGLKLEMIKGPVDVIVIDHAEKPTPD